MAARGITQKLGNGTIPKDRNYLLLLDIIVKGLEHINTIILTELLVDLLQDSIKIVKMLNELIGLKYLFRQIEIDLL